MARSRLAPLHKLCLVFVPFANTYTSQRTGQEDFQVSMMRPTVRALGSRFLLLSSSQSCELGFVLPPAFELQ